MSRSANKATADVDRILRDQIVASADQIVSMMSPPAKIAAIGSIDVASFVLNIARGIPAITLDHPEEV